MRHLLPLPVCQALTVLRDSGFTAYLVGGCVRALLMGSEPHDYDMTTNARPEQIMQLFEQYPIIDTGLQHGTVLIILDHMPLEVTTYRIDGPYTDRRRPDKVYFTDALEEDLSRRDFTINAMAWTPKVNQCQVDFDQDAVIDPFGGQADLTARLVRCVGDPVLRFSEDALRILRALRFASVLSFEIEEQTARAAVQGRDLLRQIAVERIFAELSQLLCGPSATDVLSRFWEIITILIPELGIMIRYDQNNPHHHLDLQEHTLQVLSQVPPVLPLRLAALLHDLGKPWTRTIDTDGIAHFTGHQKAGADLATAILNRLRADRATRDQTVNLILYHDSMPDRSAASVKRWLNRHGPVMAYDLLTLKQADLMAQSPDMRTQKLVHLAEVRTLADEIIASQQCYTQQQLAISGRDLIALGMKPGRTMGRLLDQLLQLVIEGILINTKPVLIEAARHILDNQKDS